MCFVVVIAAHVCNVTARPEALYTDYIIKTNFLSHLSSLK